MKPRPAILSGSVEAEIEPTGDADVQMRDGHQAPGEGVIVSAKTASRPAFDLGLDR